jgi:DNA mismatch repair protein MutL
MNTFIVAETDRGMVIIDQHVAHERILYEYLCGLKGASAIEKQALLVPQTLHLDRRSAVLLRERIREVIDVGFDLEPFGGESYVIRAVPAAIRNKDPLKILRDLVDELVEASVVRKLVPTREQIWITSACHMAVKAGDPLSLPEMEKLIYDLALTENPYLCPHGRPITATLTREAMLRLFKRT